MGSLSPRSVLFKIIVGDGTRGKRQGRGELFQEDEGITLVKDFERELGVSTTVVMAYFPLNMNSIYESKSYSSAAAADSRGNRGVVVIVSPACVVPLFRHPHNPLPSHHTSSSAPVPDQSPHNPSPIFSSYSSPSSFFLIPYSLFLISFSFFLIPYSLFLITYYLFVIHYSLFLSANDR